MSKEPENIRIKDIAKMAGVSTGTVDRVLHNRGRVSNENIEKVNAVLKIVNYQPNMIARSLASKKQYHIIAVIPSFEPGEYWEDIAKGIEKAATEFEQYNVYIEKLFFDQYNNHSFDKTMNDIFKEEFDGIIIATLFTESVIRLSKELDKRSIPYNYIDSNIPDQNQLAYYGTNSFDGGAIGAKIMLEHIGNNAEILVTRIIHDGDKSSNQCLNRENGFRNYLNRIGYSGKVHCLDLKIGNSVYNFNLLDQTFDKKDKIKGVIIFNSTCHKFVDYMKVKNLQKLTIVGYDVIEKNAEMLKEGQITALIAQRPQTQGYEGIKTMCNYLIFDKVPSKENYMPIDILIQENVSYYTNSSL